MLIIRVVCTEQEGLYQLNRQMVSKLHETIDLQLRLQLTESFIQKTGTCIDRHISR